MMMMYMHALVNLGESKDGERQKRRNDSFGCYHHIMIRWNQASE